MRVLPAAALGLGLVLALKLAGVATVFGAGAAHAEEKAAPAAKPAAKPEKAADAPADPVGQGQTASEADVLESLATRREQLDARERELDMREKIAAAAEKKVEERISELKTIEAKVETMFGQRDQAQKDQIASLVKTYEAMKPADAAKIFNTLNRDVLLDVVVGMKPAKVAPVLAAMQADKAQEVTVAIAMRLALPKTDAMADAAAAAPAAPPPPVLPAAVQPAAKPAAAPAAKPGAPPKPGA